MLIEDIDLSTLPSVYLLEKEQLPNLAAIYFVCDSKGQVLYIGRTVNLVERWKDHHRFQQLKRFNRKNIISISWMDCSKQINLLSKLENKLIKIYNPSLNWTRVVSPIRKITSFENNPIPLKVVDKYQPNYGNTKNVIEVEPWEELEPMPEGEARVMNRQFLYVDGVEIEVCYSTNEKYFVRYNVYWWIIYGRKNPNIVSDKVIQNLESAIDRLPTIRWSGYRFRVETIVFSEDDVEVESILFPLVMFEDLIRWLKLNYTGKSREELEKGEYKPKPDDPASIKLCAWLQRNSLSSLLQT
ncbi:XRE family transcriptional regulator [Nostoc commune NIES-4072]|uniref:XRE family transcriptional regulator n=1 Tax=Nostoc commune NIES-4072 TaxID=2005467 RepID=A0A2R5FXT6_NOSCO|nr:GIY-YIG nuclease family protein [Nostoc commune]BBD70876.1 XRE family transcriptional regulator [Nostoc commune HK-02]GBG23577.1 XRE family transcriptional regulator [Nostoc commune NIES-4072]